MESREEIESMRVIDLRDFLRRNGSLPAVVTRGDGTPGAPRKADLMRAALAIEEAHRQGRPISSLAEQPALAPYTPPSPARRIQRRPANDDDNDDFNIPNPFQSGIPTPTRTKPSRSSISVPSSRPMAEGPLDQTPVAPTSERRKRRASAAWINPALFNKITSSTAPKAAQANDKTSNVARAVTIPDDKPILVEDEAPPRPAIGGSARRSRTPSKPILATRKSVPAAEEVITLAPLRDLDLPEEDDYDADFDPDSDILLDDPLDDDEYNYLDVLPYNDPLLRASGLDADRRDVLVHSDHDSTIDTDDELVHDQFSSWDVFRLRKWLKGKKVRYPRDARRIDLVSLARAHLLQIEASSQQFVEEDVIRPATKMTSEQKKSQLARGNRTISAPAEDEDDTDSPIDVDAIPPTVPSKVHRIRRGRTKGPRRVPVHPRRRFRFSASAFVVLLGFLLCIMCIWSAATVYRSHMRPFCDTHVLTNCTDVGQECRRCPPYGTCSNGILSCDPGYVALGGKVCVEDQESSIFGEELANDAYTLLSQLAGSAECGEITSGALSRGELKTALRLKHSERPSGGPFPWSARTFDLAKFEIAFDKAVNRLEDGDFTEVSVSEFGDFKSDSPVMSLSCAAKLSLRRNWRVVSAFSVTCLLLLFLKVWLYIRRRQKEELYDAYRLAVDYLKTQKSGFVRREEELAFLSDIVLRQEVLGSPTDRTVRLWKKVEELLRADSRVVWSANRVVKGFPSNTFEWRGRLSSGVFSSGGSLRSLDSTSMSDGEAMAPASESWLDGAWDRLFNRY